MRIGVSTAAYYGRLETEDAAGRMPALGVSCCEVFLETFSEYTAAFGSVVRERLLGVEAVSIHTKTQHFEGDLIGQSARQRQDALRGLTGALDAGAALGARVYVYHGPANIRGHAPRFDAWQEGIERAIKAAAERGIIFAWETVSWCWLNDPARVAEFLRIWPSLSFVLDIKQAREMGADPLAFVDAMGDRLCHVHILDHDARGLHALPGQGVNGFGDLARALRQNGYRGDMILEPYAQTVTDERALIDSINWLRDAFGAE